MSGVQLTPLARTILKRVRTRPKRDVERVVGFRAVVAGGVAGVCGLTYVGAKGSRICEDESEQIWFGDRGPLSADRAIAVVPCIMCIGSGVVASAAALLRPKMVKHIAIPLDLHEVLGLPLAIFLAFRFQIAFDRWWKSRQELENLCSSTVLLASSASLCLPNEAKTFSLCPGCSKETINEATVLRSRLFAILEAYLIFVARRVVYDEFVSSSDESIVQLPSLDDVLKDWPQDAAACKAAPDPNVWCLSVIMEIALRLEGMGIVTGDWASVTYNAVNAMEQNLSQCMMVKTQMSPGPWVVHLRSMLILYCASMPFAMITSVRPILLIPFQGIVSFAFLGIEFCSREMEHPYGSDKGDVPVRSIIQKALLRVRQARDQSC